MNPRFFAQAKREVMDVDREKRQRPTRAFLGDDVTEFAELAKRTHADTQGSYTGDPLYDEQPVQDVDDL